jgi:hypothetical protein
MPGLGVVPNCSCDLWGDFEPTIMSFSGLVGEIWLERDLCSVVLSVYTLGMDVGV